MAESSAKKLAAQREELESKGAKAVEALFEANESEVDLDAAQNIGLITADTRAKIKEVFGPDMGRELFQAAMDKQITHHNKPPVEAFKVAFEEVVYGKFQLEQRDVEGLEDPDGPLMKVLGKVLRFPIEKIDGKATIKGRPELEAAMRRLSVVLSEKKAAKLLKKMKPKVKADKSAADAEAKEAQAELTKLQKKKVNFDSIAGSTEEREKSLDNLVKALKRSERLDTKAKMRLAKQAASESVLAMELAPEGSHHLDDRARYIAKIYSAADCMDKIVEIFIKMNLKEGATAIGDLRTRMQTLSQEPFDLDAWKTFMDRNLKSTVETYCSEKFFQHAADVLAKNNAGLDFLDYGVQLCSDLKAMVGELGESYEFLTANFGNAEKYYKTGKKLGKAKTKTGAGEVEADIKKREVRLAKEKLIERMSEFVNGAESLFADGGPAEIQAEIASFAGHFRAAIVSRTNSIMTGELENFVNGEYKPFVSDLTEAITEAVSAKTSQASAADENLQRLTEKLKRINSLSTKEVLVEDILKKALPGLTLNADGKVKIRGFKTNFKHAATQLQAAQDHFSSVPAIEKLRDGMQALQTLSQRVDPEAMKAELKKVLDDAAGRMKVSNDIDKTQRNIIDHVKVQAKKIDETILSVLSSLTIQWQSKEFYAELKDLMDKLGEAVRANIKLIGADNKEIPVAQIIEEFHQIDSDQFDPRKLIALYGKFDGFLTDDSGIRGLIAEPKKEKTLDDASGNIGLSGNIKTQRNIIDATITSIQNTRSQRRTSTDAKQEGQYQKMVLEQGVRLGELKDLLDIIDTYLNRAKEAYAELKKLVEHLKALKDAEITLQKLDGSSISSGEIGDIVDAFEAINIDRRDFDPKELIDLYAKFDGFFDDESKVAKLAKDTEKARKEIATSTNLTDAQAAKNIIGAIIAEQDPKLPLADQKKLSAMMLAGDVMKLQSAEDYRTLAERGGAAFFDTVKQVGFLEKVIGFQYKVGEKVEKPFEGLKPEQFKEWRGEDGQGIENLFDTRRLDYKGGFLLLAAFEAFDGARGEKSAQIGPLEEKLKELLAVALGVEERMDEAGVAAIVNEAFEKQLEATRPLVQAYFAHVDKKRDVWETNRVRGLNTEHKALRDLYRTGGINTEQYRQRLEELREKAENAGVLDQVGFAQSSIMKKFADSEAGKQLKESGIDAGQALNVFWNNPVSQWFRDRGFDLARASGNAAGRILGHGAAGTVKLGASLGLQTALMPFRFGKYALMTAGMPFIGFINLWRKQKWTPYSLKATVSQDVSRAIGYAGTTGKGIATGVAGTAKDVVAKDFVGAKWKKYEERIKVKPDKAMERAKELWESGQATPLKIASDPWIDLEKYKAKVKELDAILAGEKEKKAA